MTAEFHRPQPQMPAYPQPDHRPPLVRDSLARGLLVVILIMSVATMLMTAYIFIVVVRLVREMNDLSRTLG